MNFVKSAAAAALLAAIATSITFFVPLAVVICLGAGAVMSLGQGKGQV